MRWVPKLFTGSRGPGLDLGRVYRRWDLARHLELIPEAGVSSVPIGMRQDLVRQQALYQKVAPGRGGVRPGGREQRDKSP